MQVRRCRRVRDWWRFIGRETEGQKQINYLRWRNRLDIGRFNDNVSCRHTQTSFQVKTQKEPETAPAHPEMGQSKWTCPRCTLCNPQIVLVCDACHLERPSNMTVLEQANELKEEDHIAHIKEKEVIGTLLNPRCWYTIESTLLVHYWIHYTKLTHLSRFVKPMFLAFRSANLEWWCDALYYYL